ncbi:hypothetical protein DX912_00935 [Lysobacter soli]|uniref:Uncharacterized protein n=1 Tax=Lysobacter soli TaxID=453783 RepID=A0A3D8VJ32_9GAMM|nr:hypothetical protein DX912_00935 [Lysobacter soli]
MRFDVVLQDFARHPKAVIPAKAGIQAGCVSVCHRVAFGARDSLDPGFRRDDGSGRCNGDGQADA